MSEVAARAAEGDREPRRFPTLRLWRNRLLADQAREKVCGIIRQRQYELGSLIAETRARSGVDSVPQQELEDRIARAEKLSKEPIPTDRAEASALLDKLDFVVPLLADEERLRLMLEIELDRDKRLLGAGVRQRASQLIKSHERGPAARRQLELLLAAAVRERDDELREQQFTSDLRQNYLTWLGTVLLLLLVAVAAMAIVSARAGLWADVLLATFAGALGGTLSGVIRLRAPEQRLTTLKNLGLVMLVQPLVGAVGGIILFALWKSGAFTIAGLTKNRWASVAVVAFAGGFSERLFLRSIARIGGAESTEKAPRAGAPS
jgi:hypothetical protein